MWDAVTARGLPMSDHSTFSYTTVFVKQVLTELQTFFLFYNWIFCIWQNSVQNNHTPLAILFLQHVIHHKQATPIHHTNNKLGNHIATVDFSTVVISQNDYYCYLLLLFIWFFRDKNIVCTLYGQPCTSLPWPSYPYPHHLHPPGGQKGNLVCCH